VNKERASAEPKRGREFEECYNVVDKRVREILRGKMARF
jgi:hypothetical protein